MAYTSLYQFTIFCIVNCYSQSTISRPPVEFLLNQNLQVFQVDVKEFIHVGNGGVSVGCGTTIPQGSNTHVNITMYDGMDMKTNSGTNILFWTRNELPLNLSCKIMFTTDNKQISSVSLNDIVIQHITLLGQSIPECFPRPNTTFLEDELAAVFCVSDQGYQWKNESGTLLLERDQLYEFLGNDEVFSNYILSSTSGFQNIKCTKENNNNNCAVEGVRIVNALNMTISPTTFSNISNFSCNSNVPTEYISWHVKLGSDVMVEVGPGSDLPWPYVINVFNTSSSFAFPEGAHGLKSVSCSTSRAGHFVMVTAKNATNSTIPTEPNVVCDNDCSSKNASSKDACKSVAPFITTIVILVIICIILAVVTGFLAYKQARPDRHQKTDVQSDVGRRSSTMNGGRAESAVTDMNVYTGVGDAAKSLPDSDGHLSTDMLDYGAVVTTNNLYQAS